MRAGSSYIRSRNTARIAPKAGIDLTSSPMDVHPNRGTYMRNLIGENGSLSKRPGWQQTARMYTYGSQNKLVYGRVHGMWHFDDGNTTCMLVHAGGQLFQMDSESGDWAPLAPIADAPTCGVQLAGRLWLAGAGEFLVFDYDEKSGMYTVNRVADMEDIYIPTTTVGISDAAAETDARTSLDAVNLLTAKRKNKMIGQESVADGGLMFRLDGKPRTGSDVTVEIEIGTDTYVRLTSANYREMSEPIAYAEADLVVENSEDVVGKVDYLYGTVTLYGTHLSNGEPVGSLAPPAQGIDNITVTFEAEGGSRSELLDGASFGILFGENGLSDRLLLGGFASARNTVYYSEPGNPLYFPDTNRFEAGSDAARIIGFSRVSDGVLAIHKEKLGDEPTIHYLTMEADANEEAIAVTVTPRVTAGNLDEPILSRAALCDFYGDPLALTERGVVAVTLRTNLATAERQMLERSLSIRTALEQTDSALLSRAVATVYKGRYYLALPDGSCYVADGGDTYTDSSGRKQYEWYILDNIPATAFCSFGGHLYFGTADGRVCRMGEASDGVYKDRSFTEFFGGTVGFESETGRVPYDPARLDVQAGEIIRLDAGLYEPIAQVGEFTASDGTVRLLDRDEIRRVYTDMSIRIVGDAATGATVWQVRHIDRVAGTFMLYDSEYAGGRYWLGDVSEGANVRLLHPLDGEELLVASVHEADEESRPYMALKRYDDDAEPLSVTTLEAGTELVPQISGRVIRDQTVVAVWYSAILALGGYHLQKTVHSMTVSVTPGSGRVSVGYETRDKEGSFASQVFGSQGIEGVDFGMLSFTDFSFVGFASSYTKMLNRRRVNSIQFRFLSDTPDPCRVHDITVTYSNIGTQRGGG